MSGVQILTKARVAANELAQFAMTEPTQNALRRSATLTKVSVAVQTFTFGL